ncbi:MAG: M10 family metallopeptidase C-terminal domain-containing protein [Hyphomicrobiaceae bacterium]
MPYTSELAIAAVDVPVADGHQAAGPCNCPGCMDLVAKEDTAPAVVVTGAADTEVAVDAAMAIGSTRHGAITTGGVHDRHAVDLVAGQQYTFAMVGTGANPLVDTYLRLYDPDGTTLVAANDDGLQNLNSTVTFTPSTSGLYYIDAAAYSAGATGQYGISATLGTKASFDADMIAGVMDSHASWSLARGTGAVVTYGFRDTYTGTQTNFAHVGAAQQAAITQIFQFYSEITGLTFQQVNPGGYTDNATILFSDYSANDGAGAYAYYPGSTAATASAGDVWMNTSVSTTSLPAGGYSYFAIMHELGHALGLSHPGSYNAGVGVSITYANNAQFIQDSNQFSIMSYFGASYTGASQGGYADSPMLYDIAALQAMYGANTATRATDTVYGFGSTAGDLYDFTKNTTPALSIWDGGGTDTIDASGFGSSQNINLISGEFSSIGGLVNNITIAYGAKVENAVGGSGNDTITGNTADNSLRGGAGTDTVSGGLGNDALTGGLGNDILDGGAGVDTGDWSDASGNVVFVLGANGNGTFTNAATGTDTYTSLENVTLGGGNDILVGNAVDNILAGGAGVDSIDGAAGADTMIGGDGNDHYTVDNAGDVVVETNAVRATGGFDVVHASINYTLGTNVEQLMLNGGATVGTGNSFDNILHGVGSSNALTLDGGAGNDVLYGSLVGGNTLTGGSGVDTLYAKGGHNAMSGGDGNDIYYSDSSTDVFVETNAVIATGGRDTLYASGDGTVLGDNLEQMFLQGNAVTGVGNAGNNYMTAQTSHGVSLDGAGGVDYVLGTAFDDILNGGSGIDTLVGLAGNDTYIVDHASDNIVEGAGAGTDLVLSSLTRTLGNNLENLTLTGTAALSGVGNSLANVLTGNSGANVLDGAAGADTMIGGDGNDHYYVDNAGDAAIETNAVRATGGFDVVHASVNFTLGANIEQLVLSGGASAGTGNGSDNVLYSVGSSLVLTLDGGAGNDTIYGSLVGGNTLIGGEGVDTMFARGASNTMTGGNGNDIYYSESATDTIVETATGGFDTTYVNYDGAVMAANIDQMVLQGNAVTATGNGGANNLLATTTHAVTLDGGAGGDYLNGSAYDDILTGGLGNDTIELTKGGHDTVRYLSSGFGNDRIYNFDASAGLGGDLLDVSGRGFTSASLGSGITIAAAGSDTLITIGTDTIRLMGVASTLVTDANFKF